MQFKNIAIAIAILAILILVFASLLIFYYMHHGFSSGSWFNDKGDTLLIRNRGLLGNSEMLIAEQNGDKYNVLKYKCKMLVNPLSLPHRFTMYIFDDYPLTAKIDMITGKLRLKGKDKDYGTFSKSNL
jgi:hypothetical protein